MKLWIIFLLCLSIIPLATAAETVIRDGTCQAGETCLFSQYQHNNSHVAECGYYNFSVCYPHTITLNLRETGCEANEHAFMTRWQRNDSHVGTEHHYNFTSCIANANVTYLIEGDCAVGDIPLFSMYQGNNSHVGAVGYYNFTVCESTTGDVSPPAIIIFTGDVSPPAIIIFIPVNNSAYDTSTINLNVSGTGASGIQAWWYMLDEGSNNTFTPNITLMNLGYEAWHEVIVYANDTYGNIGHQQTYFYIGEKREEEYYYLYVVLLLIAISLLLISYYSEEMIMGTFSGLMFLILGIAIWNIGYLDLDNQMMKWASFLVVTFFGAWLLVYNSYKLIEEGA